MADIELVIKLPEEDYERCKKRFQMRINIMGKAIANGTPLPKGHDRLIEVSPQLEQELFTFTRWTGIDEYPYESATIITDNAPTIIGADKESEDIKTISSTSKDEQTALKDILENIRTEIGEVYEELDGYDPDSLSAFLGKIDDIFDKHKADSLDAHSKKKNNDLER